MLRLKRHSSDKVSIVWRERTSPSKRLVTKAFVYSLLIHCVMLMAFQIRINYVQLHGPTPTPTVFLDSEESAIAVLTDMKSGDEDPRYRFSRELHLSHSPLTTTLFAVHSANAQSPLSPHSSEPATREFLPIINLPWSFSDEFSPSRHICRVYPLKVTLHQNLRSLQLIDDGSHLFRKATFETLFSTPTFSEIQPRVEFKVDVISSTGKIDTATCIREMTDKRLQGVASHIVKCLRFRPSQETSQKTISGILTLQFAGTFDTISNLLDAEPMP